MVKRKGGYPQKLKDRGGWWSGGSQFKRIHFKRTHYYSTSLTIITSSKGSNSLETIKSSTLLIK